ncbi:hypothetical protein SASPL_123105 [Salvia splendens]|uniref:Ribosome biogenesis protein YTM1 n=1 Tax=Salvia splendens TaxID=180675 RepID=A0A8X8ZT38_SALSN|nr:hypothetical protein SASPL_123105 [Salvia splendens]
MFICFIYDLIYQRMRIGQRSLLIFLLMESWFACHLKSFLLLKAFLLFGIKRDCEKVLEIEYIKAVDPRKQEEPSLHDDWVSAVDGSSDGYILTGCYDGFGRIWKAGGVCTHVLVGNSGPLTSVCNLMPKVDSIADQVVATSSKDRTLRLWKFGEEDPIDQPKKIRSVKILRGHTGAVQSIAAIPSSDMLCSGSWDCTINLWNASATGTDDSISVKKRKTGGQDEEALSEGDALTTLVGHTQCVSTVVWPQRETIYSGGIIQSEDGMLRQGKTLSTWVGVAIHSCGKAINCLSIGGESSALIAAGGSDPVLRVWDPRRPGTLSPIFQFSSHNSWISSCKWHDKSWYHLVSASFDGKVMMWDLRTAVLAIGCNRHTVTSTSVVIRLQAFSLHPGYYQHQLLLKWYGCSKYDGNLITEFMPEAVGQVETSALSDHGAGLSQLPFYWVKRQGVYHCY